MTPHQVTPTSPGTREALAFDMRPADQGHTRTELRVEAQARRLRDVLADLLQRDGNG